MINYLSDEANDMIESVCRTALSEVRFNMEYMITIAVKEAYQRGYEAGKDDARKDGEWLWKKATDI